MWQEVALKDMHDESQFRNEVRVLACACHACRSAALLLTHTYPACKVLFRRQLEKKGCHDAVLPLLRVHVPEDRMEEFRSDERFRDKVADQPSTGEISYF